MVVDRSRRRRDGTALRRWKPVLCMVALVALSCCAGVVSGEEDTQMPDFGKMRVKQLRKLLAERGVECRGCAEKSNFVERVRETYHLPVVHGPNAPRQQAKPTSPPPDFDVDSVLEKMRKEQEQKQKLMETLRKSGFNTGHMNMGGFDANSFEEAMKRGEKSRNKRKAAKTRKRKPRTHEDVEGTDIDEEIEL